MPIGEKVVRSLDVYTSIGDIAAKGFDFKSAATEAENLARAIVASAEEEPVDRDVIVDESIVMEGFRYRVDDTKFPVFKGHQKLTEFPIIPIGMLGVWRDEQRE